MKKLVFAAIVLFTLACSGPQQQDGFLIKGNIKGLRQKTAFLLTYKDGAALKLDSSVVDMDKGTFRLQGKVETPDLMYIAFPDGSEIEVFVENAMITFKGDSIQNTAIAGSRSNDEYAAYKVGLENIETELNSQQAEYDSVLLKYNTARKAGNETETRLLYDQLAKIEAIPEARMKEYNLAFVKNHGSSFVAPVVLWNEVAWSNFSANEGTINQGVQRPYENSGNALW